eukprot:1069926-Heterocapsa_arctica.AAC.1
MGESSKEARDLQEKLATSQKMFEKVEKPRREEKQALEAKSKNLSKIRAQSQVHSRGCQKRQAEWKEAMATEPLRK